MANQKKILIICDNAGGGHKNTANSIQHCIDEKNLPWDVEQFDMVESSGIIGKTVGKFFVFLWNFFIKHDMIRAIKLHLKIQDILELLWSKQGIVDTRKIFVKKKPDMVISVSARINDVAIAALDGMNVPFAFIVTDMMEKGEVWFTPRACKESHFIIVAIPKTFAQAKDKGAHKNIITAGLIVHNKYKNPSIRNMDIKCIREKLVLDTSRFTILIMMGAAGNKYIYKLINQLNSKDENWHIIACCGHNKKLKANLEKIKSSSKNKLTVLPFSKEIHFYMRASDIIITKPGPQTIWEAIHMQLPIVLDAMHCMPQEEPNVDFVEQNYLGVAVRDRDKLPDTIRHISRDKNKLDAIRKNMQEYPLHDTLEIIISKMQEVL